MTLKQWIAWKAKSIITGFGVVLVGVTTSVVADPQTATQLKSVLPLSVQPFIPIVLGALAIALVHRVPNQDPDTSEAGE